MQTSYAVSRACRRIIILSIVSPLFINKPFFIMLVDFQLDEECTPRLCAMAISEIINSGPGSGSLINTAFLTLR